jgi:hypothetical protein
MKTLSVAILLLAAMAGPTAAAIVTEAEVGGSSNNTIATAESISDAAFTTPVSANVFDPPGWATASIVGTSDELDVDFFTFTTAGGGAMFDIDDAETNGLLALFNESGVIVAFSEVDSAADAGSPEFANPFIGVIDLAPGIYHIAYAGFWGNTPNWGDPSNLTFSPLTRPDGEFGGEGITGATAQDSEFDITGPDGDSPYTLHISLEQDDGTSVVPEPTTLLIWSLLGGAATVCGIRRKRASAK